MMPAKLMDCESCEKVPGIDMNAKRNVIAFNSIVLIENAIQKGLRVKRPLKLNAARRKDKVLIIF